MRDFFTALALIWCLYNTWSLHHNFKQDKRSNILDQITLKVLKIQDKRLDKIEKELKMEKPNDDWIDSETLEACEDVVMFGNEKFRKERFPEDEGFEIYDLIAKYGLRLVLDQYLDYKKEQ